MLTFLSRTPTSVSSSRVTPRRLQVISHLCIFISHCTELFLYFSPKHWDISSQVPAMFSNSHVTRTSWHKQFYSCVTLDFLLKLTGVILPTTEYFQSWSSISTWIQPRYKSAGEEECSCQNWAIRKKRAKVQRYGRRSCGGRTTRTIWNSNGYGFSNGW